MKGGLRWKAIALPHRTGASGTAPFVHAISPGRFPQVVFAGWHVISILESTNGTGRLAWLFNASQTWLGAQFIRDSIWQKQCPAEGCKQPPSFMDEKPDRGRPKASCPQRPCLKRVKGRSVGWEEDPGVGFLRNCAQYALRPPVQWVCGAISILGTVPKMRPERRLIWSDENECLEMRVYLELAVTERYKKLSSQRIRKVRGDAHSDFTGRVSVCAGKSPAARVVM